MYLLKLSNLSVSLKDQVVLKEINFVLSPGEKMFILGPNGAGKTTLIETIMGFVPIKEGEIRFKGKLIATEKDFWELRRSIGYVFQNPDDQLFSPTVEEELAFGPLNLGWDRAKVKERVEEILKFFGIEHLRKKNTYQLSGGEKRIVSIACVLTMDPEILIMDEPSNGLDEKNFRILVEFLKNTDKSVIVVTHDKELVKELSWRTCFLRNGRLTEE
jgi:cobalt/nickel transport system ATP-binding protein